MPAVTEASAVSSEHLKYRRPRNQLSHLISETDPNPQIPSLLQSTRCKSTISSLLLSSFSNNTSSEATQSSLNVNKKKNNFSAATFRGFGCTAGASQRVSVPAVIRTSADWQGTRPRKKKHKRNGAKNNTTSQGGVVDGPNSGSANSVDFQDVWCGPGIGFSADVAAPVDCVMARKNVSARGKIDAEKIVHRERRRTVNPESIPFLNSETEIFSSRSESFGTARYYRHVPHPSSDGFAEMMMLQGNLIMGGRLNSHDHFRDWRLDIDNMSYEQLLELGERIGYVNTGLKEDEMGRYIRRFKLSKLNDPPKHQLDKKCSICQEEYEADDEVGRLRCEHSYHFQCLRQWLAQKNCCPVCKQDVVVRRSVAKS